MPITFILGQNCDVILSHASILAGVEIGFVLDRSQADGGTVKVVRSAYQTMPGTWVDWREFEFRIVIGSAVVQPDLGISIIPRDEYYDFITAILAQHTGINFKFNAALGVLTQFTGLQASRRVTEEFHGVGVNDYLTIKLNNGVLPVATPMTSIVFAE